MVVLYSSGPSCVKCNVLEKKLKAKNIDFEKSYDLEEVISKGFQEGPVLKVDDDYMDFVTANTWVNGR